MSRLDHADLFISIAVLAMRALTLACKLGLAIFIGRYLDLASLGIYSLAVGAVTLVPVVVGLGLVHVIMREAVLLPLEKLTGHLRDYWLFTTTIYVLLLALASGATVAFGFTWLFVFVIAITTLEHLGNDVFQLLSNLEKPFAANINAFIRGAAWILLYIPVALWDPSHRTLNALLAFWLGGTTLAFVHFVWIVRKWPWKQAFTLPLRVGWIRDTIQSAFVVYLSDLSFVVSQQLDRYVVTAFLGLELAGVYFLYWSAANAVSMFVSIGVLQIRRPRLIRAFSDQGARAHRLLVASALKAAALTSAVLSVIVAGAFYLVLPLLRQPTVADHLGALGLIMAGMAVRNVADVGAMALFTARRDKMMTLTNAAAVVALAAFQVLLLPVAGLYGAGASIVAAFAAIAVWRQALLFGEPAPDGDVLSQPETTPVTADRAALQAPRSQIDC